MSVRRRSIPVAVGGLVILLAGSWLLASASWNRRGEPEAVLALTEREVAPPWGSAQEGTALELRLLLGDESPGVARRFAIWRHRELPGVADARLGRDALKAIGFRVELDPGAAEGDEYYARQIPRRGFVVVEHEGEAWERWIARREARVREIRGSVASGGAPQAELDDAEALLALDRTMRSRLFPVDAGRDPAELRKRHPDRRRYAILPALFRAEVLHPTDGTAILTASARPIVFRVHASREIEDALEPVLPRETYEEVEARERREAVRGWPEPVAPRYAATLAVGGRYETWLRDVEPTPGE